MPSTKKESLSDKELKQKIKQYDLTDHRQLLLFINKSNYSLSTLSRLAELANNQQTNTAAYYTDNATLHIINSHLPNIDKDTIRILEPSVGTGNFLIPILKKYGDKKKLIIDVCDVNNYSLEITKLLLDKFAYQTNNTQINYIHDDFLLHTFKVKYDLIIGNPPFLKLNKKNKNLINYQQLTNDNKSTNLSSFFLLKSLSLANNIILIMPKYFLNNEDFKNCRDKVQKSCINKIIDFGEKGFKGVLIETICLFISNTDKPNTTECISVTYNTINILKQDKLTDNSYPNWLMYRNEKFDHIANSLKFNIFTCFRDRQLTNKILKDTGDIWVIRSRNISRNGLKIEHIKKYDTYLDSKELTDKLYVSKYLENDQVYLCPNMTYYPRVIKKPKNTLVNGSVAIFTLKKGNLLTAQDLLYFASDEFRYFYKIARNMATRSLNIDNTSIYYFGKKHGNINRQ